MKVKITEYKGFLLIETLDLNIPNSDFIPSGGSNLGCILKDTEKNLGISKEALVILQKVEKSRDVIGSVMAWDSDGTGFFGWMGNPIQGYKNLDGDKDYNINSIKFTDIPNTSLKTLTDAVDNL